MTTLIHITDLHFGRITPGTVDQLEIEISRAAPDLCIISGDLTMRSRPREWREVRGFIDRLLVPAMVIPGNHDLPYVNLAERFMHPYHRFRKFISETLNPRYHDDQIAVMGVNTARSWVPHWTWKEGDFSVDQLEMAEDFFKKHGKGRFKIIFTHHPFMPPPEKPRTYLVRHARRALRKFEELGIDLLLGGHLHLSYSGDISVFHTMIKRCILCVQASTATSSRLRNGVPDGFNIIETKRDHVDVHGWEWNGKSYQHTKTDGFNRIPDGWASLR